MRHKFTAALLALLVILAALAAGAPARAADEPVPHGSAAAQLDPPGTGEEPGYDCPYINGTNLDALCLYDNNYAGPPKLETWWPAELRNRCLAVESSGTAAANSVYNRTNYVWRLFRTRQCDGSHMAINPYTYKGTLPSGWSNYVVAVSRTSTTG